MQNNSSPNGSLKEPLTRSQQDVLDFIQNTCATQGAPPSYREIQEHFGFKAVGSVQGYVKALIKKGYLENPQRDSTKRKSRGLFPSGFKAQGTKRIPIYGEIAAGSLRDTPQIELGSLMVAQEDAADPCFALRVVGDSMVEAGIFEGDHLIVERGARVRNGDIVVALVGGETTVKRYKTGSEGTFLIPENKKMKPIRVTDKSFQVQGKVVGLQRKL
ncbi:transcriptional repressor LexA [bacterium]|nr:transcriptional repressor LexA [bacterium]